MQIPRPFIWLQPDLEDFVSRNGTQPVCDFVGSSRSSVERWAANKNPAQGMNEIRLWHFLLAAGYDFPELRIDEFNFYLAQLHVYSIITIDEVMQLCGVKNSQTALQIMRGQPPMHPAMSLEEMRTMYDEQLKLAMAELRQQLGTTQSQVLPDLPSAPAEVEALAPTFDALVPVLADQLKAAMPLIELVLWSCTPEQRAELRELVGANEMFVLSNNLNALCSERARSNQGRR